MLAIPCTCKDKYKHTGAHAEVITQHKFGYLYFQTHVKLVKSVVSVKSNIIHLEVGKLVKIVFEKFLMSMLVKVILPFELLTKN